MSGEKKGSGSGKSGIFDRFSPSKVVIPGAGTNGQSSSSSSFPPVLSPAGSSSSMMSPINNDNNNNFSGSSSSLVSGSGASPVSSRRATSMSFPVGLFSNRNSFSLNRQGSSGSSSSSSSRSAQYPLHDAVTRGDLTEVKKIIEAAELPKSEKLEKINKQDKDGKTALHAAVANKRIDILQYLIKSGADVKVVDNKKQTPLHLAALSKNVEQQKAGSSVVMAQALINALDDDAERKAYMNMQDVDDNTALHISTSLVGARTQVMQILLNYGANADIQNNNKEKYNDERGIGSGILLILACEGEKVEAVNRLLNNKISNYHDGVRTPLIAACSQDSINSKIVDLLLCAGADASLVGSDGKTAIHKACINGNMDVAAMLIASLRSTGKEIPNKDVLIKAISAEHIDSPEKREDLLAILNGVQNSKYTKDIEGNTPLHIACRDGSVSVIEKLIRDGADKNAYNYNGLSPLHLAARHLRVDAYLKMIGLGADPLGRAHADIGEDVSIGNSPLYSQNVDTDRREEINKKNDANAKTGIVSTIKGAIEKRDTSVQGRTKEMFEVTKASLSTLYPDLKTNSDVKKDDFMAIIMAGESIYDRLLNRGVESGKFDEKINTVRQGLNKVLGEVAPSSGVSEAKRLYENELAQYKVKLAEHEGEAERLRVEADRLRVVALSSENTQEFDVAKLAKLKSDLEVLADRHTKAINMRGQLIVNKAQQGAIDSASAILERAQAEKDRAQAAYNREAANFKAAEAAKAEALEFSETPQASAYRDAVKSLNKKNADIAEFKSSFNISEKEAALSKAQKENPGYSVAVNKWETTLQEHENSKKKYELEFGLDKAKRVLNATRKKINIGSRGNAVLDSDAVSPAIQKALLDYKLADGELKLLNLYIECQRAESALKLAKFENNAANISKATLNLELVNDKIKLHNCYYSGGQGDLKGIPESECRYNIAVAKFHETSQLEAALKDAKKVYYKLAMEVNQRTIEKLKEIPDKDSEVTKAQRDMEKAKAELEKLTGKVAGVIAERKTLTRTRGVNGAGTSSSSSSSSSSSQSNNNNNNNASTPPLSVSVLEAGGIGAGVSALEVNDDRNANSTEIISTPTSDSSNNRSTSVSPVGDGSQAPLVSRVGEALSGNNNNNNNNHHLQGLPTDRLQSLSPRARMHIVAYPGAPKSPPPTRPIGSHIQAQMQSLVEEHNRNLPRLSRPSVSGLMAQNLVTEGLPGDYWRNHVAVANGQSSTVSGGQSGASSASASLATNNGDSSDNNRSSSTTRGITSNGSTQIDAVTKKDNEKGGGGIA